MTIANPGPNPEDRRTQPLPVANTKATRGVYARWARRMTAPRSSATPDD